MHDHLHSHFHRVRNVLRTHARRKDPTNTTRIRRAFEQEINRRFSQLKKLIRQSLVEADALALKTNEVSALGKRAFEFRRSGDKVQDFMDWLKRAEDDTIFSIIPGTPNRAAKDSAWANIYLKSAYQQGLQQSASHMRAGGIKVSPEWADSAFFRPIHADRLGLAYTRTFTDLVGVTDVMDVAISRILSQGLGEGRNPVDMARDIVDKVDGIGRARARTIARTEVISAHAEASLNAYTEAGLSGVKVRAEWSTAGDDRVCDECADMEGKEFDIEDAHGMIPLHPNCRCAFIPVVGDPEGKELR